LSRKADTGDARATLPGTRRQKGAASRWESP
jgi:hypothetical protein